VSEKFKTMANNRKPHGFWTFKGCVQVAKRYKTRTAFCENSNGAYCAAHKNGWLCNICKHMKEIKKPSGFWTYRKCVKEAKKYKSHSDFQKNSGGAYAAARRNGWLDEFYPKNN